jgi:hypothetical protein
VELVLFDGSLKLDSHRGSKENKLSEQINPNSISLTSKE